MDSCIVQPPESLDKEEIENVLSSISKYNYSQLHKKFRWFLYDIENNVQLFYEERENDVRHVYTSKEIPKEELLFNKNETIMHNNRKFKDTELVLTQLRIPEERIIATYRQDVNGKSATNYIKRGYDIQTGQIKNTSVLYAHNELDFDSNVLYELYKK